jgi:hypothetical protein
MREISNKSHQNVSFYRALLSITKNKIPASPGSCYSVPSENARIMKNSFVDYDEKSFEQFLKALLS